jgi:hypothetical protein
MSDFKKTTHRVGFSTGALERGDFRKALGWMSDHEMRTVELSALRFDELEPLIRRLDKIDVSDSNFDYVSFHAPSYFSPDQEERVIELLQPVKERNWNIVVHPDVLFTPERWSCFGRNLLIENMDRRKPVGRNSRELSWFFDVLPEAQFCLDLAHARQIDPTLMVLKRLASDFKDRIAEIHISELDPYCKHVPMSNWAILDYQQITCDLDPFIPVIIESMLDGDLESIRMEEFYFAIEAMECSKEEAPEMSCLHIK